VTNRSKVTAMSVGTNRKRADHSGSTFDSFLEQEGIREEVEAVAVKRVLAWQSEQAIGNTKNNTAQRKS
jgi:hypothetical protein